LTQQTEVKMRIILVGFLFVMSGLSLLTVAMAQPSLF
jgi:hypothetical protein